MADSPEKLRQRVIELQTELQQTLMKLDSATADNSVDVKEKISNNASRKPMHDAVTDDNPYSRLMALQTMGVVTNYADITEKTAIIVGIGGVGSVVAEMLTRCGIGKLILYDLDTVVPANMNRLFFRAEHFGLSKVDAAAKTLQEINPDVIIEPKLIDVTSVSNYAAVRDTLLTSGLSCSASSKPKPVDLLLCCVDNYAARIAINRICLDTNIPWMESGVSEDAVSGHTQTLLPGITACFECLPPLAIPLAIDENTIRRKGVCAASLPTVMGVIAGMLAQNALKFLLDFGDVCWYQRYASMINYFQTDTLLPNEACTNELCRARQVTEGARRIEVLAPRKPLAEAPIQHEANEWGIEVEAAHDAIVDITASSLVATRDAGSISVLQPAQATADDDMSLEALMASMDAINDSVSRSLK